MRLAWAGYGLLGVAGTATLALALTFRSFDAGPRVLRNRLVERLQPVAGSDSTWCGTYRLFSNSDTVVFDPDGVFRGRTSGCGCNSDYHCGFEHVPEQRGSWEREGSVVRARGKSGPALELELGILDGEYVLLSEFSTWRRVPEPVAKTGGDSGASDPRKDGQAAGY